MNLAFCLFFFREPERDPKAADKSTVKVFVDTMKQLWHDQAMFRFLLVVSGPLYDAFSSKTELARKYLVEHVHMAAGQVANIEPSKVMSVLAEKTGTTGRQTVDLLWDKYHPWIIWCILGLVGLVSIVGMIWNYKVSKKEA